VTGKHHRRWELDRVFEAKKRDELQEKYDKALDSLEFIARNEFDLKEIAYCVHAQDCLNRLGDN